MIRIVNYNFSEYYFTAYVNKTGIIPTINLN